METRLHRLLGWDHPPEDGPPHEELRESPSPPPFPEPARRPSTIEEAACSPCAEAMPAANAAAGDEDITPIIKKNATPLVVLDDVLLDDANASSISNMNVDENALSTSNMNVK